MTRNHKHRIMKKFLLTIAASAALVSCTTTSKPQAITPLSEHGVKMIIASEIRDCVGVGKMQCMLIKENNQTEWSYFYSGIEGFTYQPGFEYELIVEKIPVANPPADGSSIRYRLTKEVKKEKKQSKINNL